MSESFKKRQIIRHESRKEEWSVPTYTSVEELQEIEQHFEKYIGKSDFVLHELISDTVHIDVYHVEPTPERNYHTLFTIGMSVLPMKTPQGAEAFQHAELLIHLPPSWNLEDKDGNGALPEHWLRFLARFPHLYNTWLGWGHTIPNGDPPSPIADGTELCGTLLIHPMHLSEEASIIQMSDGRKIWLYSLFPIYEEEMEHKLNYGADSLLDKIRKENIPDILNLTRKNVCKPSNWKTSFLKFFK